MHYLKRSQAVSAFGMKLSLHHYLMSETKLFLYFLFLILIPHAAIRYFFILLAEAEG